jgi:Mg/Co/Ni transporter MgtE
MAGYQGPSSSPQQAAGLSSDVSAPVAGAAPGGSSSADPADTGKAAAAVAVAAGLHESIWVTVSRRLSVLVTLLLLQSMSQFILESFEGLIANNMVIPLFLTMLVGAGGNAGNQAAVRSITGLATGEFTANSYWAVMRREMVMGLVCAAVLFLIGAIRVYFYYIGEPDITTGVVPTVFSVAAALFAIVASSVVIGAALPFWLLRAGLNVEHAAPAVQVLMDILGVFITCVVCSVFLPSGPPPVTTAAPLPMPVTTAGRPAGT